MNKFNAGGLVVTCVVGGWLMMGRGPDPVDVPGETTGLKIAGEPGEANSPPVNSDASTSTDSDPAKSQQQQPVAELTQADEDAARSKVVPGVWETNRDGRRVLTVLEDGTATMDVTVEGAFSFVVGSKMKFNIKWKIEDGKLDFEMIDGEPESSVNAVISMYGKSQVQEILEFSTEKFVLKDNDGEPNHVWTRVSDESAVEGKS